MGLDFRRRKLLLPSDPTGLHFPRIHSIVTEGLVSWWDFRGGYMTMTLIDRIGGNDGTIENAIAGVFWQNGKQGLFDGVDEYADILDSVAGGHDFTTIGNNDNYTLEAWILTSKAADDSEAVWYGEQVIFELRNEGSGTGVRVPFSFGVVDTFIQLGKTDNGNGNAEIELGSIAINDGDWHHVVAVSTNDVVDFYIDGILDVQRTFTTATGNCSVAETTANMQIGIRSRNGGEKDVQPFEGQIGSVRIYNRLLTAGEVDQNFRAG